MKSEKTTFNKYKITNKSIASSINNLPLTNSIAFDNTGKLDGIHIVHINHTLSDVYAFNLFLTDILGAKLTFIGVPYNNRYAELTPYDQYYALRSNVEFLPYLNGKVDPEIKPNIDYIALLLQQFDKVIRKLDADPKVKKIIIIEDGGYSALFKRDDFYNTTFAGNNKLLGIVEQTTAGTKLISDHLKLNGNNPVSPIISIAKSELKSAIEAQFISDSIFYSTQEVFRSIGTFLKFKSVIVGGYGIIGRSLAFALRNAGIFTKVKEIDPLLIKLAQREGFQCFDNITRQGFEDSELYLGCTGSESFTMDDMEKFLKSNKEMYYLASGSSKRVEFWPVIRSIEQEWPASREILEIKYPYLSMLKNIDIESTEVGLLYKFTLNNSNVKGIHLLGEGFPINFTDPEGDGIPDRAIDLTQATFLSALLLFVKEAVLKKDLYYFVHGSIIGDSTIDENIILSSWIKLNGIELDNITYPLESFNLHPLREYIRKKRLN